MEEFIKMMLLKPLINKDYQILWTQKLLNKCMMVLTI